MNNRMINRLLIVTGIGVGTIGLRPSVGEAAESGGSTACSTCVYDAGWHHFALDCCAPGFDACRDVISYPGHSIDQAGSCNVHDACVGSS